MPVYEYLCGKCDTRLEKVQSMSDSVPICCNEGMRKLPTAPSMIRIIDGSMTRVHSAGYKDGYAKEYQRSIGIDS